MNFFVNRKKVKPNLEFLPDAILLVTVTGEITDANRKAHNLFSVPDFGEHDLLDLFDGGFTLINDLVETGSSAVVRSKVKMDEDIFIDIKASGYGSEKDFIIISMRDVSGSQRMLNKLIFEHEYLNKLTKEKNTFISKISSELTSPLHSVIGFSQAVLEGLSGEINEKQQKYLTIINKNSEQLMELVEKVVEYSKLESGIYDYEFKNFDFVTLVTNIFNEYKPKADKKKLILNVDLNNLAKRNCYNDENLIKNAIENLVDTAIKSTDSGHVQVSAGTPDFEFLEIAGFKIHPNAGQKSYLMVQISDTSAGLTDSETVFNPYLDLDKVIAKKELNKKMSTALAHGLIKQARGKIWVESEPMKGTTFTFIVPAEKFGA